MFDRDGNLYVTYSGTRGQQVPVSIFRVRPNGTRETFSSGIVNPTSMAIDPEGRLYVSSRFEGTVYRVMRGRDAEPFATDLGVACGLAFAPDGTLFVGDRSGTIFRVDRDGTRDDVRDAAGERRGVSPGARPRRRAVRHRPDAVVLRPGLPHRSRRRRSRPRYAGVRAAAGPGVRSARIAVRRRGARRRRAACIGVPGRAASRSSCSPVPGWSAWRSIRTARSSCARTTRVPIRRRIRRS